MSCDTLQVLVFIVWAGVALLAAGIGRELDGDWERVADALPMIVLWPLFVVFLAVVGVGWCLLWTGRGPVRLLYLRERKR